MDLPDAPVKIAHGFALGTVLDFWPIPVINIPLAYLLGRLIGVNGLAAAFAAAFFKLAAPFFFFLNILTGNVLPGDQDLVVAVGGFNFLDRRDMVERLLENIGYPFLAGALINSALAWTITYFTIRHLLICRQRKRGIITGDFGMRKGYKDK